MSPPWSVADIPDQAGRTVVVTGATSGLGLASAKALAAAGARVLLAARNPAKAEGARDEVAAGATGPEPEVVVLDLADLESVRAGADDIAGRVASLDVLMNNAGVMALPLARTAQGFEMQLGTNHLGHFALTGLLLPQLLAAPAPRVVTTSSNMHKTGRMRWDDLQGERRYRRWPAYGQSKLANLLFTYELDRRARVRGPRPGRGRGPPRLRRDAPPGRRARGVRTGPRQPVHGAGQHAVRATGRGRRPPAAVRGDHARRAGRRLLRTRRPGRDARCPGAGDLDPAGS